MKRTWHWQLPLLANQYRAAIWLAKQSICPAISCSWSATHMAAMTACLIYLGFLCNLFFFSSKSLSSLCILHFLSSISIAARAPFILVSSSGTNCKMEDPNHFIYQLLLSYLGYGLISSSYKRPKWTKCWKPFLIRSSKGNLGNRTRKVRTNAQICIASGRMGQFTET